MVEYNLHFNKSNVDGFLAEFYTENTDMTYDEAIDSINRSLETERLEILSTTDTNKYGDEFEIFLYYIIPDQAFIYRVRPLNTATTLYKEKVVNLEKSDQSDIKMKEYISNNVTVDRLKEDHGFDLDTFSDHILDDNNKAPFSNWRECLQALRITDDLEAKKAILAYLTYNESDEILEKAVENAQFENRDLLDDSIIQDVEAQSTAYQYDYNH